MELSMKNKKYINSPTRRMCFFFSCFVARRRVENAYTVNLASDMATGIKALSMSSRRSVGKRCDFGAVFDRGEFASFYRNERAQPSVEGRNHIFNFWDDIGW